MSQLSDVWGARDEEEEVTGKPQYALISDMLVIHKRIVAIQDRLSDQNVSPPQLRQHTSMVHGCLDAVLNLNESYFHDRPANRRRVAHVAEFCRETEFNTHVGMIIRGEEMPALERNPIEPK